MSDKFRTTMPIDTRFSSGETIDPTKLDGFAVQTKRSASLFEYIIGDAWNSGGDAFFQSIGLSTVALMIPNISRMFGSSWLLSPRILNLSETTEYSHIPVASDVGEYEMLLSLPPTAGTTFTVTGTGAPVIQPDISLGNVAGPGEWYVNRDTGYCYFADSVRADWIITYIPTVASEMGSEATSNVIPDPNTHASFSFRGCKIAYTNNVDNSQGYIIYLPPRGPLSSTRRADRSPQSQFDASSNVWNMSVAPGALPVKLWHHYVDAGGNPLDATVGVYADHYRYNLPKIITDNWVASSSLPVGFVYLWDHSQTGTLIEGLSYSAENAVSPSKYIIIASGSALDTWVSSYMDTAYAACGGSAALTQRDNHDPTYYPANGLRLLTVGNSATSTLSQLTKMFLDHDHGSANSQPGKLVSHGQLTDNFFDDDDATGVVFFPSTQINDWHPQYMNRGGSTSRDIYGGGMLTDLFMCASNSAANYQNLTSNSRRLRFGSPAGPTLGFRTTSGHLDVVGDGFGVESEYDYFSISSVPAGNMTILGTTVGRIVLDSGNSEVGIGSAAFGDFLQTMPSTELRFYLNSTFIGAFVRDGAGNSHGMDLGTDARLVGNVNSGLAVEDQSEVIGQGRGGKLTVNRIYGGAHDDLTSPGVYRNQGSQVGPPRAAPILPTDFIVFDYLSTTNGTVEQTITDHFTGYNDPDGGGSDRKRAYAIYLPDNASDTVAVGFLRLPFAYYEIINVLFAYKSHSGITPGALTVSLGYSKFNSSGPLPGGDTEQQYDLTICNNVGLGVAGVWYYNVRAFGISTVAGLLPIDNRYDAGYSTAIKVPWVRFANNNGAGPGHYEFSDVIVLYRIVEW